MSGDPPPGFTLVSKKKVRFEDGEVGNGQGFGGRAVPVFGGASGVVDPRSIVGREIFKQTY